MLDDYCPDLEAIQPCVKKHLQSSEPQKLKTIVKITKDELSEKDLDSEWNLWDAKCETIREKLKLWKNLPKEKRKNLRLTPLERARLKLDADASALRTGYTKELAVLLVTIPDALQYYQHPTTRFRILEILIDPCHGVTHKDKREPASSDLLEEDTESLHFGQSINQEQFIEQENITQQQAAPLEDGENNLQAIEHVPRKSSGPRDTDQSASDGMADTPDVNETLKRCRQVDDESEERYNGANASSESMLQPAYKRFRLDEESDSTFPWGSAENGKHHWGAQEEDPSAKLPRFEETVVSDEQARIVPHPLLSTGTEDDFTYAGRDFPKEKTDSCVRYQWQGFSAQALLSKSTGLAPRTDGLMTYYRLDRALIEELPNKELSEKVKRSATWAKEEQEGQLTTACVLILLPQQQIMAQFQTNCIVQAIVPEYEAPLIEKYDRERNNV
jgi:hypothetical protein